MTSPIASHPWSEEAFFQKARYYIELMESFPPAEWLFGFWSSLALELLVRAALARVSPVLLADQAKWQNLHYALGKELPSTGFNPTSIGTKEVHSRLADLLPSFNKEIRGFCAKHADKRNAELHTGELASVTARKDDAPAADQAAITNLAGLASFSGGGGLIQTTSG